MVTIINRLKNTLPILLLFLISIILAWKNYIPGTILSGWDNLHPEFNFSLSIKRELFGVFRLNQGLGAVSGHSDMADLPHIFILYFIDFFMNQDFLRYFYIFSNLILGVVGIYFFLYKIVLKNKVGAFLGGLFYLLNLGAMQQFVVPFEMFTTQYAALPWIFLFATDYLLEKNKIKNLVLFSLVTLLSSPMAFAATLWYLYFFILSFYLIAFTFPNIKKAFLLILITLFLNLFWILPNIYFIINHGSYVQESNINQLFSKEAFFYNKEFGNIKDLALLKNFLFDWGVYSGNGHFTKLLTPWIEYLKKPFVEPIGFLFGFMFLSGVIFAIKTKSRVLTACFGPLLVSLFFLINDNPPTSFIYNFLQQKVPLFGEAFRFPQDKALGIFTFCFTIYFAYLQKTIAEKIKSLKVLQVVIVSLLLFYFMLPAFKGNFISPYMKVKIPQDYFELFSWFKKQDPNARIATLPIHSPYGWDYYNWGYQGAGFIWFGLNQPVLNRDFDRWNPTNEQYYKEMSQAIYSQNKSKLESVLKKYGIQYLLVDKSIIAPDQGAGSKVLFLKETESLLENSSFTQQVAHFGNLLVYETDSQTQPVRLIKNPPSIAPASVFYSDFAYDKYHDYITYVNLKQNEIIYPFRKIIDNQNRISDQAIFSIASKEKLKVDTTQKTKTSNDCSPSSPTQSESQKSIIKENKDQFLRYLSSGGSFCDHFSYPDLQRNQGYIIAITSRNLKGLPIRLCITNYISKRCDLITYLVSSPNFKEDLFLLPPIDEGMGFDINLNNFSVKNSPSVNDLKKIAIQPIEYEKLSQLENYPSSSNHLQSKDVIAYLQSFDPGWKAYEMKDEKLPARNAWQRDAGGKMKNWLKTAFPFLFGKELKNHVLVNNWANGWFIDSEKLKVKSEKLVVIFWPQYLEYLGFAILFGTLIWIFLPVIKTKIKLSFLPILLRNHQQLS